MPKDIKQKKGLPPKKPVEEEEDDDEEEEDAAPVQEQDDEEAPAEEEEEEESFEDKKNTNNKRGRKDEGFVANKKPKTAGRVLEIRSLSFDSTEDSIREALQSFGSIVKIVLNKGYALIEFSDASEAEAATALHEQELDGRKVFCSVSQQVSAEQASVIVKNLSSSTTEESLKATFESCGDIINVRRPTNFDGTVKDIAFVNFADKDAIQAAVALSGTDLDGSTIEVAELANKQGGGGDRGGRGRGRGGRGFGDRGGFGGRGRGGFGGDRGGFGGRGRGGFGGDRGGRGRGGFGGGRGRGGFGGDRGGRGRGGFGGRGRGRGSF